MRSKRDIEKGLAPVVQKVDNTIHQAQVVQKVDSAIHWINHYPAYNTKNTVKPYPLDSDLSGG